MITRKTAIQAFFVLLASRFVAQASDDFTVPIDKSSTLDWSKLNEHLYYVFEAKTLTLQIDSRKVTFTAKELADALGAK